MTHQYSFVSTIRDLLDAEDADRTQRMGIRRSLRWVIATYGALNIAVAVWAVVSRRLVAPAMIWLTVGCTLIYFFAGVSYMRGRQIRRDSEPEAGIKLHFKDDGVEIEQSQYGSYRREWGELADAINAQKGVLLYFGDGVVNWLPNRVFQDKAQKKTLVQFLKRRMQDATDENGGDGL